MIGALPVALTGCEVGPKKIDPDRLSRYRHRPDRPTEAIIKAAAAIPPRPIRFRPTAGRPAGEAYQNVKVLGGMSAEQFNHLMAAITQWIAPPEQGCNYCHNPANLASDEKYTKVVARRMIQMTQNINHNWSQPRQADRRHLLHLPPRQCGAANIMGGGGPSRPTAA